MHVGVSELSEALYPHRHFHKVLERPLLLLIMVIWFEEMDRSETEV